MTILDDRRKDALTRLNGLRADLAKELVKESTLQTNPELMIYATGSLARLEANIASDLDAFFVLSGSSSARALSRIRDVKILSSVIVAAERHRFPDFSNEGEYLRFLHVDDIVSSLGGRDDDYHNAFTARMLLVLESRCLFNDSAYKRFKSAIVQTYFRDFHRHVGDFKPTFLVNDVLRFWRTLCLNYEHGRQWRGSDDAKLRAKGHLSNLKLKFSRMAICFSFVAILLAHGSPLSPDDVLSDSALTPLERWQRIEDKYSALRPHFAALYELYSWFLDVTGREKDEVLSWIASQAERDDAFDRARKFGDEVFRIVHHVAVDNNYLNILVI